MALPDELIEALRSWDVPLPADVQPDMSLIRSGLLDSLALFSLAGWVEERTGAVVDPATLDLVAEWDTIADIVRFVERRGAPVKPSPVAGPAVIRARTAASPDYEIVRYRSAFRDQIVEVQRYLWRQEPEVNSRYFRWKYEENPYAPEPLVYLALHRGAVVGMRGLCGARWHAGAAQEPVTMLYADDLVVAPTHRHRGLFARIMAAALEDLAGMGHRFVVNLSAGPLTLLDSLATGWRSPGHFEPLEWASPRREAYRKIREVAAAGRLQRRITAAWSGDDAFAALDRAAAQPLGSRITIERAPRPHVMADLVARRPADGRVRHVRDAAFFAWRFRNPVHEYRFLYAWDGERLAGYLVLHRLGARAVRVNLVDWEASTVHVWRELLDAALGAGTFDEVAAWVATIDAAQRVLLRERGFRAAEAGGRHLPCLLVRPVLDEELAGEWRLGDCRLLDLASWNIRMIDSMHG